MQNETNRTYLGDYIKGQFVKATDPVGEVVSQNPGDLDLPSVTVPYSYEHINLAVAAARQGFMAWKRLPPSDRFAALSRYRDLLQKRREELAHQMSYEVGKPLWESIEEVNDSVALIDYYLDAHQKEAIPQRVELAQKQCVGTVRRAPLGVMAIISAANQPVYVIHGYWVPAVLSGNSAIIRTAKRSPLTGQLLAEIMHDSAFPSGVVNFIHGNFEVTRRLCADDEVRGVFFTGDYETGFKLRKALASKAGKSLILDLAGKNGIVVWGDATYEKALYESFLSAYITAGQRRTSAHQILVHDSIFDKFVGDFHLLAKQCSVGYGLATGQDMPFMGALDSEDTLNNYLRYQGIALREDCEEIMRGKAIERNKRGYYVSPSIHIVNNPDPKSVYQKDEFFGPNVAFYRISDIDEATSILNQTQYGLVSSIYTMNEKAYSELLDEVQVGSLHWNCPTTVPAHFLPQSGIKRSGSYRPMGSLSHMQCTYPISSIECKATTLSIPDSLPRIK